MMRFSFFLNAHLTVSYFTSSIGDLIQRVRTFSNVFIQALLKLFIQNKRIFFQCTTRPERTNQLLKLLSSIKLYALEKR